MGDPAEDLYEKAIQLSPHERRAFALRLLASVSDADQEAAKLSRGPAASWETIASLQDAVAFGGNAIEDCDRLYED